MSEVNIDKLSIDVSATSDIASNSIDKLTGSLTKLNISLGSIKSFAKLTNNLTKLNTALNDLKPNGSAINKLVGSLKPLSTIEKSAGLTSSLNQLKKIPEITDKLNPVVLAQFTTRINELTKALNPLANQMQKVSAGFSAFPTKLSAVNNSISKTKKATSGVSPFQQFFNFGNMLTKLFVLQQIGSTLGNFIRESNDYVENLNLFTVAMRC